MFIEQLTLCWVEMGVWANDRIVQVELNVWADDRTVQVELALP